MHTKNSIAPFTLLGEQIECALNSYSFLEGSDLAVAPEEQLGPLGALTTSQKESWAQECPPGWVVGAAVMKTQETIVTFRCHLSCALQLLQVETAGVCSRGRLEAQSWREGDAGGKSQTQGNKKHRLSIGGRSFSVSTGRQHKAYLPFP